MRKKHGKVCSNPAGFQLEVPAAAWPSSLAARSSCFATSSLYPKLRFFLLPPMGCVFTQPPSFICCSISLTSRLLLRPSGCTCCQICSAWDNRATTEHGRVFASWRTLQWQRADRQGYGTGTTGQLLLAGHTPDVKGSFAVDSIWNSLLLAPAFSSGVVGLRDDGRAFVGRAAAVVLGPAANPDADTKAQGAGLAEQDAGHPKCRMAAHQGHCGGER